MKRADEINYEYFVRERRSQLLLSATALTAGDRHLAEDLVQITLVRLYLRWPKLSEFNVMAYARRVLVNNFIDHRRRSFIRHESSTDVLPETTDVREDQTTLDPDLMTALAALPPRMRAVVVLRFVENLTVEETASALRCTTGTVKSQSSRALAKLREQLADLPSQVLS